MPSPRCAVPGCACACHRVTHRQSPRLWTAHMDDAVRSAIAGGDHPRKVAASLHLTEDSIRHRIKQLGLSCRDGWRTRAEVSRALGVSWRSIERWRGSGALRVVPHGSRWTRITEADLRAFVLNAAGVLFDASTVTDPALRRLAETAAIANRRRATLNRTQTGATLG